MEPGLRGLGFATNRGLRWSQYNISKIISCCERKVFYSEQIILVTRQETGASLETILKWKNI